MKTELTCACSIKTKSSIPYYQGLSEDYDKYYSKHYEHTSTILPQIINKLTKGESKTILDIGAGTGAATIPLAQQGHTVVSVDNCKEMINILQNKIEQLKLKHLVFPIIADILDNTISEFLPSEHNVFDGIIFWGNGLCHIDPEDYNLFVYNIRNLMKSNGWFLLDHRSGYSMRSKGTHVEVLYDSPNEIRLSCVHNIPQEGYGPIHRVLISIKTCSLNDIHCESKMTSTKVCSVWPYLIDDSKIESILISEGFLKLEKLNTKSPLSDIVTNIYRLNRDGQR